MNLYIKLFLASSLSYATAAAIFLNHLPLAVLLGTITGLVIAFVFGTLQNSAFDGKKSEENRSVHQIRDIEIDLDYYQAMALCVESLQMLNRATVKKMEESNGLIEAHTRLNWKTYGEKITFRLIPLETHLTRIHIESQPRLKSTLIDYGSNLANVNRLMLFLREKSSADNLSDDFLEDEMPPLHAIMEHSHLLKQRS